MHAQFGNLSIPFGAWIIDEHWHYFEGNIGETAETLGRARMGFFFSSTTMPSDTEGKQLELYHTQQCFVEDLNAV